MPWKSLDVKNLGIFKIKKHLLFTPNQSEPFCESHHLQFPESKQKYKNIYLCIPTIWEALEGKFLHILNAKLKKKKLQILM